MDFHVLPVDSSAGSVPRYLRSYRFFHMVKANEHLPDKDHAIGRKEIGKN